MLHQKIFCHWDIGKEELFLEVTVIVQNSCHDTFTGSNDESFLATRHKEKLPHQYSIPTQLYYLEDEKSFIAMGRHD